MSLLGLCRRGCPQEKGRDWENRQARDIPMGELGHRLYPRVLIWKSEASLVYPWRSLPGRGCPGGWHDPPHPV